MTEKADTVRWSLLKNIWPFIVIIFMLGATWTSTTLQVSQLRSDLMRTQQEYMAADARLASAIEQEVTIRSDLTTVRNQQYVEIKTLLTALSVDILWIKDNLQDKTLP
jgi:hypothetical protein